MTKRVFKIGKNYGLLVSRAELALIRTLFGRLSGPVKLGPSDELWEALYAEFQGDGLNVTLHDNVNIKVGKEHHEELAKGLDLDE